MTSYIKYKMSNRNPVKQLFITFPKSNVDKQTFRDALLRFEPSYYKVCEEKHKDGTPHLHAVVKFKNKYSKAYVLKHFKELYPDDYKRIDVKPVRSIKNSIAYLSKEDPEPLESGEFVDGRNPQDNLLLGYCRFFGFSSLDEFKEHCDQERTEFERIEKDILKFYKDAGDHNYEIPYLQNKLLDQILKRQYLCKKDDITFIYNNKFSNY